MPRYTPGADSLTGVDPQVSGHCGNYQTGGDTSIWLTSIANQNGPRRVRLWVACATGAFCGGGVFFVLVFVRLRQRRAIHHPGQLCDRIYRLRERLGRTGSGAVLHGGRHQSASVRAGCSTICVRTINLSPSYYLCRPCELRSVGSLAPVTLDPADSYDATSVAITSQIFDQLFSYVEKSSGPDVVNSLAVSTTISEDELTYSFEIRDDVFFANGDKVNAADVVFSWCRVLEIGSPITGVSEILSQSFNCDGLAVTGDYTFDVNILYPSSVFVSTLAFPVASVINQRLCEDNFVVFQDNTHDWCTNYLRAAPFGTGSGAFAVPLNAQEDESKIILEPNYLYWKPGPFGITSYTRVLDTNLDAQLAAFQTREVDLASIAPYDYSLFCKNISPNLADAAGRDGFNCEFFASFSIQFASLHVAPTSADDGTPILNWDSNGDGAVDANVMASPSVRSALAFAFNYKDVQARIYDNTLVALNGPLPAGFPFHDTQSDVFRFDLDEATRLLDEAGFVQQYACTSLSEASPPVVVPEPQRDGFQCRLPNLLRLQVNPASRFDSYVAEVLREALAEISVAAVLVQTDSSKSIFDASGYDVAFKAWSPDYLAADNFWTPLAGSAAVGGDVYNTGYANPQVDAAVAAARESQDAAEQDTLYSAAFAAWSRDPNMVMVGQFVGLGILHEDLCQPPYLSIGARKLFDYTKLEVRQEPATPSNPVQSPPVLVGTC